MIFRNLDSDNDWNFGASKANFARDKLAIGLNIKTRINSWVGDCFFDLPAGIDWWNRLGSKDQRQLLELDLRRIILQSEGVTSIESFDTTLQGRIFSATYTVNTVLSEAFTDTLTLEI